MLRTALVLAALGAALRAQQAEPDFTWPMTTARRAFEAGQSGYLAAVLDLLDREAEARKDPDLTQLFLDVLGAQWALVGEEQRATAAGDEAFAAVLRSAPAPEGEPFAGLHPVPALDTLVALAQERRLVLVNEEHRSSIQRAFSNRLLAPLREAGFNYLALETLSEDDIALAARGYPIFASGTYTRDPVFGDIVRRALALGYKLVPYEASNAQMARQPDDTPISSTNRRESAQAHNLYERSFAIDPQARVLVIAGRDHIAEAEAGGWIPMGAVLERLSGRDPLTVNQFVMCEHSRPELEHWAYRLADEQGWLAGEPVILVDDAGLPWSANPEALDISLFHPRTRLLHGRPQWMAMGGLRQPVEITPLQNDAPLLLQARVQGESEQAIPLDQCILWPGAPAPALMLRPGSYEIVALDRAGHLLRREERTVK